MGVVLGVLAGIVIVSGFVLWIVQTVRDRPPDQAWWRYLLFLKTPRFEWQLYAAGSALMLVGIGALGYTSLILLVALPIYAWVGLHWRQHRHPAPWTSADEGGAEHTLDA